VKVAFDSRVAAKPFGVGRYASCLLRALRETAGPGDEVVEAHRLSASSRSRDAELFHFPWLEGAMLRSPVPTVLTLHDLSPLKRRSEQLRLRLRLRNLAVQRAACVIVPTEAVARDAVAHLPLERERIVVIPEAADPVMGPRSEEQVAQVRRRLGLPERYLLWVGSLQHPDPGKQIAKLAAAPHGLPLVLVGPTRPWAYELPGVMLTGEVSDEQLAAIYSGAHALVLPSVDEGFGLPAVEALACGTPVAACETPALREALGARATFVAPGDMAALLAAGEAAARPAPEPPPWSWRDAARATWRVYERALASARQPRPAARLRPRAGGSF
jgi:glycosyltransferase involved in cell wall biosynthesis